MTGMPIKLPLLRPLRSARARAPASVAIPAPLSARRLAYWLAVALFITLMAGPLVIILRGSFDVADANGAFAWSLSAWRTAFHNPAIRDAILNTVILTAATQVVSLPVGVSLAWLIGRTDVPGRRAFEFLFWISFFLPPLAIVQGWILLFDPTFGLLNTAFQAVTGAAGPFNIYTYGGIVFAHLVTTTVSAKVMMLTPAFQNMDSRYEEAARTAGDSRLKTALRITIPIIAPAIAVTALMGIIRSLESFEIELFLGAQQGIEVYSTKIYHFMRGETSEYAPAYVLGSVMILLLIALVVGAKRLGRKGARTTISSAARANTVPLGPWRWPAAVLLGLVVTGLTIVPIGLLLSGSLMSMFGFFNLSGGAWTLNHWREVFADPLFTASLWNTLVLALGSAALCLVLSFAVAYGILRGPRLGRALVDIASWAPYTTPGVLFSMAIFWVVIQVQQVLPVYGSTAVLIVTIALASLTLGAQSLSANLQQLSSDLEEAAWASGASRMAAIRTIVLPLATRSLAVVAVMAFVASARNIGHLSLLVSSDNKPLAILQLEYLQEGRYEASAVIGAIIVAITIFAAMLLRRLGLHAPGGDVQR